MKRVVIFVLLALFLSLTPIAYAAGYTNLVPTSIDSDGSVFNGIGYAENSRLNSSGAVVSADEIICSGFVAYDGDVIRIYGSIYPDVGYSGNYLAFYDSSFETVLVLSYSAWCNAGASWEVLDGKYMLTVDPSVLTNYTNYLDDVAYIRASMCGSSAEDFVITLSEPISGSTTTESTEDTEEDSRLFMTTSFDDYTVTEGFLLLIFVLLLLSFFLNLFRR